MDYKPSINFEIFKDLQKTIPIILLEYIQDANHSTVSTAQILIKEYS